MTIRRAALVSAFTVLLSAPPAVASTFFVGPGVQAGPILAGDALIYTQRSDEGEVGAGVIVRRVMRSGEAPAELARAFPRTAEGRVLTEGLSASSEGFAVSVTGGGSADDAGFRVLGGLFSGPSGELARCRNGSGATVSGRKALVSGCTLVLTDLSGEGGVRVLPAKQVRDPRFAGTMAAWIEGGQRPRRIVVFDTQAGRVVRSFPAARISGSLADFDVREDGSLAVAYTERRRDGAWVGTVGRTGRLARLRVPAASSLAVRYRGSSVAVLRAPLRGPGRIVLARPGRRTRTVATRVAGDERTAFDYDGRRLAWRAGSGSATRLRVQILR